MAIPRHHSAMVQIQITAAAYEAIRAAFPDTTAEPAVEGEMTSIWLDREVVKALNQARAAHETLSDVILRTAAQK